MKTYVCVRCGREFEANKKSAACNDCREAKCIICGKLFKLQPPWTQQTCSPTCRGIYRKESGIASQAAAKSIVTKRDTSKPLPVLTKICKQCGKEFQTTSTRRQYCYDEHYGPCPACGKSVKIKEMSIGPQACSEECRQSLIAATSTAKYGNSCVLASDYGREKSKETCLAKYGTFRYASTDEYREQFRRTMQERYGVDSPLQNADIMDKLRQTNLERYGVAHVMESPSIQAKSRVTAESHGGIGMSNPDVRAKIEATNQKLYGVRHTFSSDVIRHKCEETMMLRYGTTNYGKTVESIHRRMLDNTKLNEFLKYKSDPKTYVQSHYLSSPTIRQVATDIGVDIETVRAYADAAQCRDIFKYSKSSYEIEVIEFIKSINPDITIIHNDKIQIAPLELDIFLPDFNLGIEVNPTVTHNSSISDPWGQSPKPYNYHQMKSNACEEKGIFLFHIFGYEWTHKKKQIQSMLTNLLNSNTYKIYARNTHIDAHLSAEESKMFLNANHRQGSTSAKIRIGLRRNDNNELVSVMTFNKLRANIGKSKTDSDDTWELSRFCSLQGTSVVGGASKLLSYFKETVLFDKIVSYSDIAHTRGHLYEQLGFHAVHRSSPNYVWVEFGSDNYLHRVQCMKSHLPSLFNEPDLDIEHQTEKEIMISHGYVQVFDSGVTRWELPNIAISS